MWNSGWGGENHQLYIKRDGGCKSGTIITEMFPTHSCATPPPVAAYVNPHKLFEWSSDEPSLPPLQSATISCFSFLFCGCVINAEIWFRFVIIGTLWWLKKPNERKKYSILFVIYCHIDAYLYSTRDLYIYISSPRTPGTFQ